MAFNKNGLILYTGPSLIDGAPIVVIATGLATGSANSKTGAMIQTFILTQSNEPHTALKLGEDYSICGDCPHRGNGKGEARTCYVNLGHGPLAVYRCWKRGNYKRASGDFSAFEGRVVRFGTYGDPAAVPAKIWENIASVASGTTGYTHQWQTKPANTVHCMASVDSIEQAKLARDNGMRYFRVATDQTVLAGEVICPASEEAGKKVTCEQCQACNGLYKGRKSNIVIMAHGTGASKTNIQNLIARVA